jgi:MFS superfamily sulfate permease-like transporter
MKNKLPLPKDGITGLKDHFLSDALSGFSIFLLALPLSLGIAKASEFPPIMGLLTAAIGGIIVSFFAGSPLTIKGPAAGLIVIVAGAVNAFGGGELGWHLTLGALFIAGFLQILFGYFKLGKLTDFFPLSAVHGMLAAIGLIIIIKQIPVFMDINPELTKAKEPLELLLNIPKFLALIDTKSTLVGVVSLWIMLSWSKIKHPKLKKIPAPLMVLLFAIPAELILNFQSTEPKYALVNIGNIFESIKINIDFSGIEQAGIFIKYVIMFAVIGSIESLLTIKAIDMKDPYNRKSNSNQDLIAVGIGNTIAAIFGGLPMISEVARSSANISNGAKTRWANFFHGMFILIFVLIAIKYIEMIPNSALAAMLISVGIKLAHPREFVNTFKIGKEQLAVFITTICFTFWIDLLVGIVMGMICEIIINIINGKPLSVIFKAPTVVSFDGNKYLIEIDQAAVFTNFMGIKRKLDAIPSGFDVTIDLSKTKLIDHSTMENLHTYKKEYQLNGGTVELIGLNEHIAISDHQSATRIKK